MPFFHDHNWVEIARTYAPPHNTPAMQGIISAASVLERAAKGLTTILWECKECKNLRREELLGKIVSPTNIN